MSAIYSMLVEIFFGERQLDGMGWLWVVDEVTKDLRNRQHPDAARDR